VEKWQVNKVKDVSPSPWFPIEQHEVQLSDGRIVSDYFITTLADVAMVLPITNDGKVVIVRQYKHGQREFMYELPAGFVQAGKSIEESALAELEEETGIKTDFHNLQPLGKIAHIPTKSTQVVYGYLAQDLEFNAVQKLDELEEIEVILVEPAALIDQVLTGQIWASDSAFFILKAYHLFPDLFKSAKL